MFPVFFINLPPANFELLKVGNLKPIIFDLSPNPPSIEFPAFKLQALFFIASVLKIFIKNQTLNKIIAI